MGADDYMTKPFGIEELLARILATLRRTRPATDVTGEAAATVISIGDVQLDLASQQVRVAGEEVHLTPTEFALLRELAVNRGKLLSRTHLLRRVWGHGYETETEYVRVYIRRLRAKLEAPGSPPLIVTQPRAGYRIPAELRPRYCPRPEGFSARPIRCPRDSPSARFATTRGRQRPSRSRRSTC